MLKLLLEKIDQVAATESSVLISGETGTGKELVARAIHDHSDRKDRPLVKVNCVAHPSSLIESALFGHAKGAYTGALAQQLGCGERVGSGETQTVDVRVIAATNRDLQQAMRDG